ncbi:MAG TPA: TPM domain-containing protein [Rhodocyclaceae bacterium]|nr:TPM domain-containing protein [Rhodocyclaceae bacterium]
MLMPRKRVRRAFPKPALAAIGAAVGDAEKLHDGELRFVVEGAMPLASLWRDETPRQRAVEVFARLRIWDTERNNGVLIYVQLADREVEVLADRGIARRVAQAEWDGICRGMEAAFKVGDFRRGALEAVEAAGRLLARHFPARAKTANDLPDAPVVL